MKKMTKEKRSTIGMIQIKRKNNRCMTGVCRFIIKSPRSEKNSTTKEKLHTCTTIIRRVVYICTKEISADLWHQFIDL